MGATMRGLAIPYELVGAPFCRPLLATGWDLVRSWGSTRLGRPANTTKPPALFGAPGSRPDFGR